MIGRSLAVIPARGGSKRIPRKNIRPFFGRPIIEWSIAAARQSALFDRVIVSTDDRETAAIAGAAGAEVPFLRSAETSGDHATIADVLREVLERLEDAGERFDRVCCLFATAPMIRAADLASGVALLNEGNFDVVIPVVPLDASICRSFERTAGGALALKFPEHAETRTQDLPQMFVDAGQWVWTRPGHLRRGLPLLGPKTGSIVLDPTIAQDIDTEEDWARAEAKFAAMRAARNAA